MDTDWGDRFCPLTGKLIRIRAYHNSGTHNRTYVCNDSHCPQQANCETVVKLKELDDFNYFVHTCRLGAGTTMGIFKCLRCLHEWPSKQSHPKVCPKCKSPYWDKPRKPKSKINSYTCNEEDEFIQSENMYLRMRELKHLTYDR